MTLINYKLGDLIEEVKIKNTDEIYCKEDIRGISTNKFFMETKADTKNVDMSKYKVVPTEHFAYVADTSRRGDKISLAYNFDSPKLVSSISIIFKVKKQDILLPEYLYIYFNRPEFDRFSRFNSWGSAREAFTFDDMCDIDIELPPIEIQQKYVDIYKGMLENQQAYETGLEDLKLTCDAYVERLIHNSKLEKLEPIIERLDERNREKNLNYVKGMSTTKEFRVASSKVNMKALSNYKIVRHNNFVFVPTTDTWKVFANALNNTDEIFIVSQIYEVFKTKETKLIPQYLKILLDRTEFDRYARFHSWGSARETFTWNDLCEVKIPIPPIEIQNAIANIYTVYKERKAINEQLKTQIKDICPILIKGSLLEVGR